MTINDFIDAKLIENNKRQEKRNYLGASGLGDECTRRIQYQYMHIEPNMKATQIRTFDIGHCLEDLVAQWLITAGFLLKTKNSKGEQFGFSTADGKIQGHVDGIILQYPKEFVDAESPMALGTAWLWECKTMNSKNWSETSKLGVFAAKFIYFVQVQLYMAYMDLDCCLFTALNKDTSELYFEKIPFESEVAQKYSDRAVDILKATENNELFPRIANDSSFFKCKMCFFRDYCWNGKQECAPMNTPNVDCNENNNNGE